MANNKQQRAKATKEAFYVRVESGDGSVSFFPATDHIGKIMPFRKPRATCALRVSDDVVAFSLLHLTNKNASVVAGKPVQFPHGPLARLERKSRGLDLGDNELVVELHDRTTKDRTTKTGPAAATAPPADDADAGDDPAVAIATALADVAGALVDLFTDDDSGSDRDPAANPPSDEESASDSTPGEPETAEPAPADASPASTPEPEAASDPATGAPSDPAPSESGDRQYRFVLRRDDNNVVTLEGDEHLIELPRGSTQMSVYLRSPVVGRTLAIGFIGHLGKPGNTETVMRMAGMVLNSLSHLPDFRILSHIETVSLPAPSRGVPVVRSTVGLDTLEFPVNAYLFSVDLAPVASGTVSVTVDLENANPSSGRLLFHYTPEAALADAFEHYRTVFDAAVSQTLRLALGDDMITSLTYDIVLGGVDQATVDMLRDATATITGFDCTPTQFRTHE